jgi:hypothetical protein
MNAWKVLHTKEKVNISHAPLESSMLGPSLPLASSTKTLGEVGGEGIYVSGAKTCGVSSTYWK